MARLPTTKRVAKEDIKGSPSWFDPFLSAYNTALDAIWNALQGTLTFVENIQAQIKEMAFTTSADYSTGDFPDVSFTSSIRMRVKGVFIMQIQRTDGAIIEGPVGHPDWQENAGIIQVRYIGGLLDSTRYTARFLVV